MSIRYSVHLVLMVCYAAMVHSAVILVPGDQPTIQAGIDAADGDDTVVVADGTYTGDGNRDIEFNGKSITVISENGPGDCVIDCRGTADENHRGFIFHSGEGENTVLQGFTIQNGNVSYSGGMTVRSGSQDISARSEPMRYDTDYHGGAIFCTSSSPRISNCIFRDNYSNKGGAVSCVLSAATIENCTFEGNTVDATFYFSSAGGGIYCEQSSLKITNCIFSENRTESGWGSRNGGGIYCRDSSGVTIDHCSFTGNVADSGGGICCAGALDLSITRCTFTGNLAKHDGGGVAFNDVNGSAVMTNCCITANRSNMSGGGVSCDNAAPAITFCTFSNNTGESGGGISCSGNSRPGIRNSILWDDSPGEIHEESGYPYITYSIVQGGYSGIGNMDADPLFIEPESDNYRLSGGSPGIDAGTDRNVPGTDLAGIDRPRGGAVDMGAYEYEGWPANARVYIRMPSHTILPGDSVSCTVEIWNAGQSPLNGYPLFVLLNVSGTCFWAPGFSTTMDNYIYDFPPGVSHVAVLDEFSWPHGAGVADGIVWYAALTDPDISGLYGAMGVYDFGWSD